MADVTVQTHVDTFMRSADTASARLALELPLVDVESFGAVGDGTTDDSAAINSALASGNAILTEGKTFLCNSDITVPANTGLIIQPGAVIKKGTYDYSTRAAFITLNGAGAYLAGPGKVDCNATVDRATREAYSSPAKQYGVWVKGDDCRVFNVEIDNCFDESIACFSQDNLLIQNVTHTGFGKGPILYYANNAKVLNLLVRDGVVQNKSVFPHGLTVYGSLGVKIDGFTIDNWGANASSSSTRVSCLNVFGCYQCSVENYHIVSRNSGSTKPLTGLYEQGGYGNTYNNIMWKDVEGGYGAEIASRNITFSNFVMDFTLDIDDELGTYENALYLTSAGIGPNPETTDDEAQVRYKSACANVKISDGSIIGCARGVDITEGTGIEFNNVVISGASTRGFAITPYDTGHNSQWPNTSDYQVKDVTFNNCSAFFCENGFQLYGGESVYLFNCNGIGNKTQFGTGFESGYGELTVGSSTNSTVVYTDTAPALTRAVDWSEYYVTIETGANVYETKQIVSHDTGTKTITISGTWSTNPSASDTFSIHKKHGDVRIVGGVFQDQQDWATITDAVSINPDGLSALSTSEEYEFASQFCDRLMVGMRFDAQNIVTDSGNNAEFEVTRFDNVKRDNFWAKPIAAKTFDTASLTTGTGTITASGTSITGTGTAFETELNGTAWIKAGSEYRRVIAVTSDTALEVETAFGTPPSGAAFSISQYDIDPSPRQSGTLDEFEIRADRWHGNLYTLNTTDRVQIRKTDTIFPNTFTTNKDEAAQAVMRADEKKLVEWKRTSGSGTDAYWNFDSNILNLIIASQRLVTGDNETDATGKTHILGVKHYTNAQGFAIGLRLVTDSTSNTVQIGGGTSLGKAATQLSLFTAANNTTATGTEALRVDHSTTAGETRLLVYDVDNATLERVSVGAADSGGSGFKVLRIPN